MTQIEREYLIMLLTNNYFIEFVKIKETRFKNWPKIVNILHKEASTRKQSHCTNHCMLCRSMLCNNRKMSCHFIISSCHLDYVICHLFDHVDFSLYISCFFLCVWSILVIKTIFLEIIYCSVGHSIVDIMYSHIFSWFYWSD